MAGLSDKGFETKQLTDILEDFKKRAEQIFGDLVPVGDEVDTSDHTTLGRMIALQTPAVADLWEGAQQIYDAFNPNTATGLSLDNIVSLSGISRFPSAATTVQCLFEGTFGNYVGAMAKASSVATKQVYTPLTPVYFTMASATGIGVSVLAVANNAQYTIRYTNDGGVNYTNFTITSDGTATAAKIMTSLMNYINTNGGTAVKSYMKNGYLYCERNDPFQVVTFEISNNLVCNKVIKLGVVGCDVVGPIVEQANTITNIAVPQTGWDSIYNPLPGSTGRLQETDAQLRERFRNAKFTQASNILEAIVSELASIEGVTDVVVYENDSDTTDSKGIPSHSFMPIVLGGLTTEIGNAIWVNKPIGVKSFGDTSVTILDSQGLQHVVQFKRPTPVPLYIKANLSTSTAFPGDGIANMKQAILNYFSSNYKIGDSIIYSRLYTPINSIPGHQVNSLTLGTAPNPTGMSNITINYNQIYSLSADNIVITTS